VAATDSPTVGDLLKASGRCRRGHAHHALGCLAGVAAHVLPGVVDGVPIQHLPWSVVLDDIQTAASEVRGSERRWLGELRSYLRKVVRVHDPASGWAYCVVVSDATPDWGDERTYREYVTVAVTYFHPFGWGKGWPPNRRTSWRSGIEAT
jgi:hypothetical protein